MSVARVIEISSLSPTSFEDAVKEGIARAAQTVRQIQAAWIKEQRVLVENDQITGWEVHLLVTFVLDDGS